MANSKEQMQKIKALRQELEEKLEEQLPEDMAELSGDERVKNITYEEVEDPVRAKRVVEAILFAASKPVSIGEIRKVLKKFTPGQLGGLISEIKADYTREEHSFEVIEVAGGFEITTKKDFAPWLMKLEIQKKAKQVTQSALETLAILAYKQPITRAEIEAIRGVDASGVLTTLTERGFIKIVGRKEVPGRPFLYGTTDKFLEHFGLKKIDDLPNIEDIKVLVENSVKKEELLGRENIVEVPQEEGNENAEMKDHESEPNTTEN